MAKTSEKSTFKVFKKFDVEGNSPLIEIGVWKGKVFISMTPIYKNKEKVSLVPNQKIFLSLQPTERSIVKEALFKIYKGEIKRFTLKKKLNQGKINIRIGGRSEKYPKGYFTAMTDFQEKNSITASFSDYEKLENIYVLEEEKVSKNSEEKPVLISEMKTLFTIKEMYDAIETSEKSIMILDALGFAEDNNWKKEEAASDEVDDDDFDDDDDDDKKEKPKQEKKEKKNKKNKKDKKNKKEKDEDDEDSDEEEDDLPF
jgi:hypothetical protein